MCATKLVRVHFRNAKMTDFPFPNEIAYRTDCLLERHRRVSATGLIEINNLDAEALQRIGREVLHRIWSTVCA